MSHVDSMYRSGGERATQSKRTGHVWCVFNLEEAAGTTPLTGDQASYPVEDPSLSTNMLSSEGMTLMRQLRCPCSLLLD